MDRQLRTPFVARAEHLPCLLIDKPDVLGSRSATSPKVKPSAHQASSSSLLLSKVLNKPAFKPCEDMFNSHDCFDSVPEPGMRKLESPQVATSSSPQKNGHNDESDAETDIGSACVGQIASDSCTCESSSVFESSWAIERGCARHVAKHLMIVHTMGSNPSRALQIIVENEDLIDRRYILHEESLGKGSFGVVKKATLKASGAVRAVKSIAKEPIKEKVYVIRDEIEIMKLIDHPNCLMLYEIFEDSKKLHLVLQMCAGGHLGRHVRRCGPLSEFKAGVVMHQVLRAVRYLHSLQICHRDLKPANCLLQQKGPIEKCTVKVADFGMSRKLEPGQYFTTVAGTLSHMAPEVLAKKYSFPCDLWSCGVMSYYFLSGLFPFQGSSDELIKQKISNQPVRFESVEWVDTSQRALNFISELLVKNTERRLSAVQALGNEWLVNVLPEPDGVRLSKDAYVKIMKFRQLSKLQKAVLHVMASMLPDSEIETARRFFMMTDFNGDGMISLHELREALGVDMPNLTSGIEDDLSYTDFLAATIDVKKYIRSPLLPAIFSSVDRNGDGVLSLSEMAQGKLLGAMTPDEVIKEIEAVDRDSNGTLDFLEFKHMMCRIMRV